MATVRHSTPAEVSPSVSSAEQEKPLSASLAETTVAGRVPAPHANGLSISQRFDELLRRVQSNRPNEDVSLIRKAWEFCVQHHEGQMRASGEPYIIHPLEVAEVLAEMKLDATAIAAGLLHDSVEDTPATNEEIAADFGDQVAHIVEGVTKIDKIQFANREDRQAENVRKMLLAMVTRCARGADQAGRPAAQHAHAGAPASPSARRRLRARRWTSTRRWPTGWAWAKCAASSKTWPSATPTR